MNVPEVDMYRPNMNRKKTPWKCVEGEGVTNEDEGVCMCHWLTSVPSPAMEIILRDDFRLHFRIAQWGMILDTAEDSWNVHKERIR